MRALGCSQINPAVHDAHTSLVVAMVMLIARPCAHGLGRMVLNLAVDRLCSERHGSSLAPLRRRYGCKAGYPCEAARSLLSVSWISGIHSEAMCAHAFRTRLEAAGRARSQKIEVDKVVPLGYNFW